MQHGYKALILYVVIIMPTSRMGAISLIVVTIKLAFIVTRPFQLSSWILWRVEGTTFWLRNHGWPIRRL